MVANVTEPNYIAHYVEASTGKYLYSIPYYWPPEQGPHPFPYNKDMKYTSFEEYEKNKNNDIT